MAVRSSMLTSDQSPPEHQEGTVHHDQAHSHSHHHHHHHHALGRHVPKWFEEGSFQYNMRFSLGLSPGLLLVGVVLGKMFFAVFIVCLMVILLLRSLGYRLISMFMTIAAIIICQLTSVYIMVPLVWHSLLNLPMLMLLHIFIAVAGVWGILQNKEFLKQDPRVILLVEKGLFVIIPGLDLIMVGWVSGMLWGKEYLSLVQGITGLAVCSLFVVPLKSSFAKRGIPQDTGLILPHSIGLVYMMITLFLPGILNGAIDHRNILYSARTFVKYQAYFLTPLFLLSLIEAQGIFYWLGPGITERMIRNTRLFTGGGVMGFLFYQVYTTPSSSILPSLGILLLFGLLALTSTLDTDSAQVPLPHSLFLGGVVALLYLICSFQISWSISYTFSLLAIPFFVVQLLLLFLGLCSVVLLLGWRKDLTFLWPTYHAVFVGCEFILHKEELYPLPLLISTAVTAVLLCLRLNRVGRLPLPLTIMCVILHIMKLSQLLPFSLMPSYDSYLSLFSMLGSMLVGAGLLKLSSSDKHSLPMFLCCWVLVTSGLGLCVETILSPLLSAITHTPPTGADLASAVLLSSGFLVQSHLPSVTHSKHSSSLSMLSPSLFMLSIMVWLLQPEFNPLEVTKAIGMLAVHHADINSFMGRIITSEQLSLMAWLLLVRWIILIYASLTIASVILSDLITIIPLFAAAWLLGTGIGILGILTLAHLSPLSILGGIYALSGSVTVLLLAVIIYSNSIKNARYVVYLLFSVMLGLLVITVTWEKTMPLVEDTLHIPCSVFFMLSFACLALTLKMKSLMNRGIPTCPVICNISCVITFLLAVLFPLPLKLDHTLTVSLASCIMLLTQQDGYVIPKRSGLFLPPSILLSSVTLFSLILIDTITAKLTAGYLLQLVCLVASVPGQLRLISCLWRDIPLKYSLLSLMLFVGPNACMAQFGGNANVVYGSTAVLCFSLLVIAEFQTLRTI